MDAAGPPGESRSESQPKADAPLVSQTRESLVHRLAPVVLGAVLGVVPVIATNYLQSRTSLKQQQLDRRLTAAKEFSLACNKGMTAIERVHLTMWAIAGVLAEDEPRGKNSAKSKTDDNSSDTLVMQQMFTAQNDFFASLAELDAQRDIAEALFGLELKEPYIGTGPATEELKNPSAYLEATLKEQEVLAQSEDSKAFGRAMQRTAMDILKSEVAWASYCSDTTKLLAARVSK